MKRVLSTMLALTMLMCAFSAVGSFAEEEYVYGTMQIPYSEFYAAEGVSADVDAVTSATSSKWYNTDSLVAGTYSEAHTDDDGGDILGVVYPVAISQDDLDALGDDNYGFETLDETPAAYKIVTVEDGVVSFSAVQGESSEVDATATVSASTNYGDYAITVDAINNSDGTSDVGTIYGVLLTTSDGSVYGLRHLENIWLDQLAWSVGFTTTESHGNTLSYDAYADMMGKTITSITYITESGYHTLSTELYLSVKFDGEVAVDDANVDDGATAVTLTGFPEDFEVTYAVDGLSFEISDSTLSFADALPGSYTLTVTDASGVYADLSASFVLSTDEMPVVYDETLAALVAADGADEALAQAFIDNIATVSVNGTDYSATGRSAAAIVTSDGAIDFEASVTSGHGDEAVTTAIFEELGDYELVITATGFTQTVTINITVQ